MKAGGTKKTFSSVGRSDDWGNGGTVWPNFLVLPGGTNRYMILCNYVWDFNVSV